MDSIVHAGDANGLVMPPSAGGAQEHGYGASQFIQYLSTRDVETGSSAGSIRAP